MSSSLPNPPVLKTTIIQLNKELENDDNNYEILTNEYSNNSPTVIPSNTSGDQVVKKKRRRSSANVDSQELAKRKHETKQLHSIIEKRRRIKINREFEALKYLIPACRYSNSESNNKKSATNNNNKIDGMYKLTILKSSVEYILYLHHIIQQQHNLINDEDYNFDINFSKIDLDVNKYRNIDHEFCFKNLLESSSKKKNLNFINETEESIEEEKSENFYNQESNQLPSPEITPDMAPILSMLNKYNDNKDNTTIPKRNSGISPFTKPLKSTVSNSNSNYNFILPDPAISTTDNSYTDNYPRKKLFKSKVPTNNAIIQNSPPLVAESDKLSDQDASKTLLALRKSSIDSLLN